MCLNKNGMLRESSLLNPGLKVCLFSEQEVVVLRNVYMKF